MKKRVLLEFGNKIKSERLKRSLSQEDLAHSANVHRTYIGMIERAEKTSLLKILKNYQRHLVFP